MGTKQVIEPIPADFISTRSCHVLLLDRELDLRVIQVLSEAHFVLHLGGQAAPDVIGQHG